MLKVEDVTSECFSSEPDVVYRDSSVSEAIPTACVFAVQAGWKQIETGEEATDEEILRSLEGSGHFDFLKDSAEDIYNLEDGEEV